MPSEPEWHDADQVVELNRRIVQLTGEPFQLLSRGLLESAVARPVHFYRYGDRTPVIGALAGHLLVGIARDHAFLQGNKRTGLAAAELFLWTNGWELRSSDETLADRVLAAVAGAEGEAALLRYLSIVPRRRVDAQS